MLVLAKLFDWENALVNVKPETFLGWHKQAFRLLWRWKSRGGRPRLPKNIRRLIVEMAVNNPTCGQERVADELSLKLGDYSIAGLEDVCVVERKDLADLIHSCTTDRSVFMKRLRQMAKYPQRLLLITSALSQISLLTLMPL